MNLEVNDPDIEGERFPSEIMYDSDGYTVQLWKRREYDWRVEVFRENDCVAQELELTFGDAFKRMLQLAEQHRTAHKPHRTVVGP